MENIYEQLIQSFESRLRVLIDEYKLLQIQNDELKAELERKQTDLMHAHREVLELRTSCEHLRIANSFGSTELERYQARVRITKLVREIDKCIALLDE
jgi:FtsZ-binding cell division protein ZapB